jgi:mRNA deadenylase 3'-5' endonuclease subunit Ccr4
MKVLTWNIDNDAVNIVQRTELLIKEILGCDPDVVCLQEVIRPAYDQLISDLKSYRFTNLIQIIHTLRL